MVFRYHLYKKFWLLHLFLLFLWFYTFTVTISSYLQHLEDDIDTKNKSVEFSESRDEYEKIDEDTFEKSTKDDVNRVNNYNPIPTAGALGNGYVPNTWDILRIKKEFKINEFNLYVSDRIPLNRTLPDHRNEKCKMQKYDRYLPNTSVIIVFYNEAWSTLLRTIWSVINRSPRYLIKEIILVDDASEREFLKDELDDYISNFPVDVRILRMKERQGIVPGRVMGAKVATGDVLTFLDSHCECTKGWLEPMLHRIKYSRKSVVCPIIDVIDKNDFKYATVSVNAWGGITWDLIFKWFYTGRVQNEVDLKELSDSVTTPAMAGGLFSIDRNYFFEVGAYDIDMRIWGGENLEMSFRIWQCGGSIEIHPCSRVGHVFRKASPYTKININKALIKNTVRTAMVWMDEWADFFFIYNPLANEIRTTENVTKRLELRERLHCKPFSWYLENIWPTHFFPAPDRFFGKIVLLHNNTELSQIYKDLIQKLPRNFMPRKWLDIFQVIWHNKELSNELDSDALCLKLNGIENCQQYDELQNMFVITSDGQIKTNENLCLEHFQDNNTKDVNIKFSECKNSKAQYWEYDINNFHVKHVASEKCLTVNSKSEILLLESQHCTDNSFFQKWALVQFPWQF